MRRAREVGPVVCCTPPPFLRAFQLVCFQFVHTTITRALTRRRLFYRSPAIKSTYFPQSILKLSENTCRVNGRLPWREEEAKARLDLKCAEKELELLGFTCEERAEMYGECARTKEGNNPRVYYKPKRHTAATTAAAARSRRELEDW